MYISMLDCRCISCRFSLNFRTLCHSIKYNGHETWPVFPCRLSKYAHDDEEILLPMAFAVLMNTTMNDEEMFYFQRDPAGFYLRFSSFRRETNCVTELMTDEDTLIYVDNEYKPASCVAFRRAHLRYFSTVALHSNDLCFSLERVENQLIADDLDTVSEENFYSDVDTVNFEYLTRKFRRIRHDAFYKYPGLSNSYQGGKLFEISGLALSLSDTKRRRPTTKVKIR